MRFIKALPLTAMIIFSCIMSYAQQKAKGIITDSTGTGLSNVSITIPGTKAGTTSDATGNFSITVPKGASRMEFSQVGYESKTLNLGGMDADGLSAITVSMKSVSGTLSDVVVVGYGTQRKRDVTGTISTIKGDDFKNLPISNAVQAIQGRASGVDIVRADGSPGAAPSIRIRGTGTINNSDPLIVIDGVPSGSLSDVNPNDIASLEILKDASSSAIYGTRAANGVVLVTTKKGGYGQPPKTSFGAYSASAKVLKYLDLLTAPDLVALKKEAYTNEGQQYPELWNDAYYATQRTDWQKALYGTGKTNNADISVRGGSEKSSYSFSGNYYDEKGIIANTNFKRLSARINSEHKLLKIFTVGENFLYSASQGTTTDTRSTQAGTVWSALRFNPAIPVRNEDGSWGTSKADNALGDINNPVFTAVSPDIKNPKRALLANAYVEAQVFKGLKLRANYGVSQDNYGYYTFQPAEPNQTRSIQLSTLNQSTKQASSILEEYTVNYATTIAEDHSINFVGGYSAQTFSGYNFGASRNGFEDTAASQRNLNNGNPANQFNFGVKDVKIGLSSYFGRLNYAYKGKYLLTATLRADGSSKFPKDRQWGYFPAFSLGWRISDEGWFKNNVSIFNNLKLTGGFGVLGNQDVPNLQYLAVIGGGQNYNFNNIPSQGSAVASLPNPNITWERAEMSNISLEFGLLQSKLNGTVTYFNKNTKDMLIPFPVTETYGIATIPNQNIGTMNNHGVEVDLSYQNTVGQVQYSIGANASFIKNKVTLLYGDEKNYIGSILYGRQALEISRTYEGQPIASYYGFKTGGLYQTQKDIDDDANIANDGNKANIKPGDVRYLDQNGDGVVDENDRVNLGSPNPKMVFGINGGLSFKGFDFSFSFAGVSGVKLYNADRVAGLDGTTVFNWYAEQKNRWHGEGTSNTVPRLTVENKNINYRSSDLWIENGSYLALKNITLGHSFPSIRISDVSIQQIRVFVSCYNAFYATKYTGYSPELGLTDGNRQRGVDVAQYPSARTFLFGASLNF